MVYYISIAPQGAQVGDGQWVSWSHLLFVDSWGFASFRQLLKVSRWVGHSRLEMGYGNLGVLKAQYISFIQQISVEYGPLG